MCQVRIQSSFVICPTDLRLVGVLHWLAIWTAMMQAPDIAHKSTRKCSLETLTRTNSGMTMQSTTILWWVLSSHSFLNTSKLIEYSFQPFTNDFPGADIHELLAPDLLHQIIKGTFKDHLVTWIGGYLYLTHSKAEADRILDDIDHRCLYILSALPCII